MLTASAIFTACQKTNDTEVAAKLEMEQATVSSQSDAEATVVYDDVCDKVMGTNSEVGLEVLVYMAVLQLKHRQGL